MISVGRPWDVAGLKAWPQELKFQSEVNGFSMIILLEYKGKNTCDYQYK